MLLCLTDSKIWDTGMIFYVQSLHNTCNTEKADPTSIFVPGYIHTVLKLTSIYGS